MKTAQNCKVKPKVIPMVTINRIDERTIQVNGKTIIQDMNGKWITNQSITPAEQYEFNIYINKDVNNSKNVSTWNS